MSFYIGLISGTSADAIDAVVAAFAGNLPRLHTAYSHPLPEDFRHEVLALSQSHAPVAPARLAQLDVYAGQVFAEAVQALLQRAGLTPAQIAAIGSHGQTLYHAPDAAYPYTWQIGDPNVIAYRTGITTVADFRRRDLAAGGQGAPFAPLFHQALFRIPAENRAVLNLGGIANLTLLPADPNLPLSGFDTGPANALLDAWAQEHLHTPCDDNGAWAATGTVQPALLARLLSDAYFQRPPPKSTGRDYFHLAWLRRHLQEEAPVDVQATLVELTAVTASLPLQKGGGGFSKADNGLWGNPPRPPFCKGGRFERLLMCGGGVHNPRLMTALQHQLPGCTVESVAAHGLDPDWVEALCFAWLAKQRLAGQAVDLRSVTGSSVPGVLGGVWER